MELEVVVQHPRTREILAAAEAEGVANAVFAGQTLFDEEIPLACLKPVVGFYAGGRLVLEVQGHPATGCLDAHLPRLEASRVDVASEALS